MFIVYDLIFLIFTIFYLPVYLLRRKFHRGFSSRLGFLPKNLSLNKPIWVHAVSVGEAMAVRRLIEELRNNYPGKKFVISTVTPTGNKIAKSIAKPGDFVTYLPLDFSFIVKSVINRINPAVFIIAETEIWPNLISYLYKKNIPVITVNGRISDASSRGYLSIKLFIKPILNRIAFFCMQTERDAERLSRLGVQNSKIKVTGNMKFDTAGYAGKAESSYDYRQKLCLCAPDKLLVAGSTHPGEEEMILGAYKSLKKEFPDLKLLIAPRHPERSKEIMQIVSKFGLPSVFVSGLPSECSTCLANSVFILDSVGELASFYAISDIVFMGGSLVKKGGHNILEPAALLKPVIFGPYMFNFQDIAELFLSKKAAIIIRGPEELEKNIADLLENSALAKDLAERAKALIAQNQGATKRNSECITKTIATEFAL